MKKIDISKINGDNLYRSDCERIQAICAARDYDVSITDADALWSKFSDSLCAGWLGLPDDDEDVFGSIRSYLERCQIEE